MSTDVIQERQPVLYFSLAFSSRMLPRQECKISCREASEEEVKNRISRSTRSAVNLSHKFGVEVMKKYGIGLRLGQEEDAQSGGFYRRPRIKLKKGDELIVMEIHSSKRCLRENRYRQGDIKNAGVIYRIFQIC